MNDQKSIGKRIRRFFCTRIPVISLAFMALSWIIYFIFPRENKSIEDLSIEFWKCMEAAAYMFLIASVLFIISLIAYMCYRPLADDKPRYPKWLQVAVRIIIVSAAIFVTFWLCWLTMFIFSGSGY